MNKIETEHKYMDQTDSCRREEGRDERCEEINQELD